MFKHLHSTRRRSLNITITDCESSSEVELTNFENASSNNQLLSPKFQRKYAKSVKLRSRRSNAEESGVVLRCERRQIHSRTKSTIVTSTRSSDASESAKSEKLIQNQSSIASMRKFIQINQQKPIHEWSTNDVCDWLKSNNLDYDTMLTSQFRTSKLCGKHLSNPESAWENMNGMKFKNDRHKQEVLLKLASCLRESKDRSPTKSRYLQVNKQDSPSKQQKIRPMSASSHSNDSVTSSSDYVSGSSSSSTATAPSSVSDQDHYSGDVSVTSSSTVSTSRMMKTFSNIKHAVSKTKINSPPAEMTQQNKLHSISVCSDIGNPNNFTSSDMQITDTTTTTELIQMFLDYATITEDINLFMLSDVTMPSPNAKSNKGRAALMSRRLLEADECPLAVYKSYAANTKRHVTRRLELTQVKGIMIKIICRIGKHKLRGKQFRISAQSSVDHVIRLSLRKFRLRNVDSALFALCEISISGDIVEIESTQKPRWQNGTSLLICDRPSLIKVKNVNDVTSRVSNFKRSFSMTSNLSFESHASSSSDSWGPYNLDKCGNLTEQVLQEDAEDFVDDVTSPDVTVEDIGSIGGENSSTNQNNQSNGKFDSVSEKVRNQSDLLCVDNSILRVELRERDEQMEEMYRKVSQVRNMLEGGLQQYRESFYHQIDQSGVSSLAIESELKATEQLISDTEDMLGQLFRHQRQLLAKHKRSNSSSPTSKDNEISSSVTMQAMDELVDISGLADVELQIAVHQADLLTLKHKHQVLDMKMSLFVANRKAEKFRHMINGSLYGIVASNQSKNGYHGNNILEPHRHVVHSCEVFAGSAGYGLALRDERETKQNGCRARGTVMECEHQQGKLEKGDRLLEVNGINVQSVGSEFVARILKETTSARLVVLRQRNKDTIECKCKTKPDNKVESVPSPMCEDDDVVMKDFEIGKMVPGSEEMADWREMSALKSDLSMLMRELEITSRAKRELERDLARRKNRDVVLESENIRLKEQVLELTTKCRTNDYDST